MNEQNPEWMEFEELSKEQIRESVDRVDRQRLEKIGAEADAYRAKNSNIFAEGYQQTHGGTKYMRMNLLRRKGKKDAASVAKEKKGSSKGLMDGNVEGIFDNISDINQMEFMQELAERCEAYYNTPYATPEFLETVKSVDEYITADTYEKQQVAVRKVLNTLGNYRSNHLAIDIAPEESDLLVKITTLYTLIGDRVYGRLVPPLDLREADNLKYDDSQIESGVGYTKLYDYLLFPHEPSPNDVKQRVTDDCYMLSALASIAYHSPQFIKDAMKDNGTTVTVRFFDPNDNFNAKYVTVDKTITTTVFGIQANAVDCLWVQMIEKAFAAFYGNVNIHDGNMNPGEDRTSRSYDGISRMSSYNFMSRFLGREYTGTTDRLIPKDYDSKYKEYENWPEGQEHLNTINPALSGIYSPVAERLYDNFRARLAADEIITVGIDKDREYDANAKSRGLHLNHAYAVLKVFEAMHNGRNMMFVRLRDPYGAYTSGYDKEDRAVSTGNSLLMLDSTTTMGTFDLEWNDFLSNFNSYSGCIGANIPDLIPQGYKDHKYMEDVREKKNSAMNELRVKADIREELLESEANRALSSTELKKLVNEEYEKRRNAKIEASVQSQIEEMEIIEDL